MASRIHTSKLTLDIFKRVGQSTGLQPFALSKIAIALSLKSKTPLSAEDFNTDSEGLELSKQTICGDYDSLFTALIADFECIKPDPEEIFPSYFKAHIDRGAKMLENEFKYDYRKFYSHLCNLDKGI